LDQRRAAYLIGKGPGLDILRTVYQHGWSKASDVAKELDIHTATAVKYLTDLYKAGLVKRRRAMGKTKKVFEYLVPEAEIVLKVDLREGWKTGGDESTPTYAAVLALVIGKSMKVLGPGPSEVLGRHFGETLGDKGAAKLSKALKDIQRSPAKAGDILKLAGIKASNHRLGKALTKGLSMLVAEIESELGKEGARALVHSATSDYVRSSMESISTEGLVGTLPRDYFVNGGEQG